MSVSNVRINFKFVCQVGNQSKHFKVRKRLYNVKVAKVSIIKNF
jgi:hypothetical protein